MRLLSISKFIILGAVLTLAGCAGLPQVKMTEANKASTRTVRVNPQVTLPNDMFFQGRAQSISMGVGGLVGALAGQAMANEPKGQILAVMQQRQISLAQILSSEFEKAIQAQGRYVLAKPGNEADAELKLLVNMYGLGQTQGFSALLYPVMNVSATLVNKQGVVIWQKTDFVTPQNKLNNQGHEFKVYLENPELLRGTWTNISAVLSKLLLEKM